MDLRIENLTMTYPNGVEALKGVSLTLHKGMFGLLGPNGAGKSTLMRILSTLQQPSSGSVQFAGFDVLRQPEEIRKRLGYLPQEFGVYPKVSAEMLLDHLAVLKGIGNKKQRKEVVETLLVKTNLYQHRRKNLSGYSGGMRQRFGIAQALLANPSLIIVDEPTAGLDPAERNRFLNLLSELGQEAIVILSTHIVEDVKELCSEMAIINQGQILMQGNPMEAIGLLEGKVWQKRVPKDELEAYKERFEVISEKLIAGQPQIHIYSEGAPDETMQPVQPDLEDVYFSYITGKLRSERPLVNA
ncbi:MAG: ABC transporter ATP-binding protein [Bacteroidota bacterium]